MLVGFIFDSNRGTRVSVTAENPLSPHFKFSWHSKEEQKFKTKEELAQDKVSALAAELQSKYFSANQESTRRVTAELRAILTSVDEACKVHEDESVRNMK